MLLNVLIVLICIFGYYIISLSNFEKEHRTFLIGVTSLVALFLCMKFPFYDVYGHIYDLRVIPFIVGGLYGGRKVALSLFIGLIFFRYSIGIVNIGLYVTVFQAAIILLFTIIKSPSFLKASLWQKLNTGLSFLVFIWTVNSILHLLYLPNIVDRYPLPIIILYPLVIFISYVLVILVIEYILHNRKVEESVHEAEKMRVISELAASVSHEVRNPLTVTSGFLQLLKDDSIDFQKRKDYLDLSLKELDRAQEIITDYLTYAKPNINNELEKLKVIDEINYLTQIMTPYALMRGVEIIVVGQVASTIIGDRTKFRQSLINIVKNGIEAMSEGGQLIIHATEYDGNVVISIQDFGVGMSNEMIDRLGTPFHSMKAKGTGLGTMVAFSIIRAMKGRIKVESKKGEGTTFHLTFPFA